MTRLLCVVLGVMPELAHAEVMDKEYSLLAVAAFTVLASLAVYLAAKFKPVVLWLLAPVLAYLLSGHLSELLDPAVGAAIRVEAGLLYVVVSWMSPIVIGLAGSVAYWLGRRCRC